MKKQKVRPDIARIFRDIPITQKALRRVQAMMDDHVAGTVEIMASFKNEMRAKVPDVERVAQYNAGYARAVADLFGVKDSGGMQVFKVGDRSVRPGVDGRLRLDPEVG